MSNWLRQFSFRSRLLGLAVFNIAAVLLCVAAGVLSAAKLTVESAQVGLSKDAVADILPPPMYLIEMRLVLSQMAEGSLPSAKAKAELQRLTKEYEDRVAYWQQEPAVPPAVRASLLGAQHTAARAFIEKVGVIAAQADRMGSEDIRLALPELDALYQAQRKGVDGTVLVANRAAEGSAKAFQDIVTRSQWVLGGVLVGVVLLSVALFTVVIRSILRPLDQSVRQVHRMAQGELGEHIDHDGRDEMSQLSAALAGLQTALRGMVQTAQHNAAALVTASQEIAQGNLDLSDRTERQASALQRTSATMGQLSHTVRDNAAGAETARDLAEDASQAASRGGEAMQQVVDSMRGIHGSSRQIADIISVIDGIAFQTNILALNAAVEAARAGEQGRGFAVVAGEVRTLAQRSAAAAREIQTLIQRSVDQVGQGTTLVDAAGQTIDEAVQAIRRVADLIRDISESSQAQSRGVVEVETTVAQIDEMTQQNAALVEQSAAAADALRTQAQHMTESVGSFRLGQEGRG